jgi:hypothetical protein
MAIRIIPTALSASLCLSLLLAGCGGVSLWPFGSDKPQERRTPANATEYQCNAGKRFYVRYLDGAAWVILPEREFRLNKSETAGRYSNGATVLEAGEGEVTLREGSAVTYAGCKAAGAPGPN